MFKKLAYKLNNTYWKLITFMLVSINNTALADSNPFPSVNISGGDIVAAGGAKMQSGFKYATVGIGGLLVLVGIGVLINSLRENTRDKEHGNIILTIIVVALCETIGFALIAIGWKAFNTTIS